MIAAALSRRSQELAAARVPFVTATVVRAQSPTIVEAGSAALVLGDGTIEGFVGGVCAEHSVRAYSLLALQSGEPVLLRILPDPLDGDPGLAGVEVAREEGAVTVQNPCLSGGAIEIFLEPAPPAPRVLVVGDTPIAAAVRRIGEQLGLEMVAVDGGEPEPGSGDLALVVAAHGRDELRPLRRALESGVSYVGLVASPKRGAGVIEQLRADGLAEDLLALIEVPAGIAIGARTAAEIALSILARIVEVRRDADAAAPPDAGSESGRPDTAASAPPAPLAVDPICGMTVAAVASTLSLERDGERFYFCGQSCKSKFEAQSEHAPVAR
jgi:xanthine dehydrogenase accessory factor